MDRPSRAQMGKETLSILEAGTYTSASGRHVEIHDSVRESVRGTHIVRPNEWAALHERARAARGNAAEVQIEVTGETTLAAARRLIVEEGRSDVAILNFASATNPGGGFLSGARAQEESLARASALYATLNTAQPYYDANRASRDISSMRRTNDADSRDRARPLSGPPKSLSVLHSNDPVSRESGWRLPCVLAGERKEFKRSRVLHSRRLLIRAAGSIFPASPAFP